MQGLQGFLVQSSISYFWTAETMHGAPALPGGGSRKRSYRSCFHFVDGEIVSATDPITDGICFLSMKKPATGMEDYSSLKVPVMAG